MSHLRRRKRICSSSRFRNVWWNMNAFIFFKFFWADYISIGLSTISIHPFYEDLDQDFRRTSPSTTLFSRSEHLILSLTQIYEGNCWIINEWCKRFTELVINKKNGCDFGQVPCILTSVCMLSIFKLNGTTTRLKTSTSICFHYECRNQRLIVHLFLIIFSASINVIIIFRLIGKLRVCRLFIFAEGIDQCWYCTEAKL